VYIVKVVIKMFYIIVIFSSFNIIIIIRGEQAITN